METGETLVERLQSLERFVARTKALALLTLVLLVACFLSKSTCSPLPLLVRKSCTYVES